MKITEFNQILINNQTHDLSQIRAEIIEQECDRVGDITYDGVTFSIKYGLAIYLRRCKFEVIDDNTIKLGDATINIPELISHTYWLGDRLFKGTVKEIKEQVTKHLEGSDPEITSGSWVKLGNSQTGIYPDDTFLKIKTRLMKKEIEKIEVLT